jgi:hypothetical protein
LKAESALARTKERAMKGRAGRIRGRGRQAWRRAAEGEGRDGSEGEVAGYGGEEGEEDEVRDAQGETEGLAEGREDPEQEVQCGEPSSTRAFVGPARTENRPAAVATAATRKATPMELTWRARGRAVAKQILP